ncbi:DUF4232 domain-containing protein [Streptomyces sp. RY43-2]|uniref:DUF4232 domain-containing protein n=1 Tax=Streptomyces macrolidinus TaxID=2952607 RepID=A0ABT0ZA88_9ACTN|nr:DUF4232 domain-containing protein [Streptomyces macrolidinus]MCN9240405.1 DUF4232 domain-containing protein [Streptomyces macrolidinus]
MNTLRHRSALLAVAGTALVLSLTACQSDEDTKSTSAATSSATAEASDSKDTGMSDPTGSTDSAASNGSTGSKDSKGATGSKGSAGSADADGSAGTTGANGSSGSTGKQATASTPVCTARDVTITAAKQGGPPYTHLVLTAKNTSGHSCRLTGFPRIQFLESHKQDVPSVAKSKPAAPVVLAAGAPAYALVKLSNGGVDEDNEPVVAFSVMLEGDSTVITVSAPGSGGVAVDPAQALTGYWTPELRNGADDF